MADEGKEGGATDHLENMSIGDSHLSMGGSAMDEEGAGGEQRLIHEKNQLEEKINQMNKDMYEKNEKILELLEMIEDLKIQIYSRDKTVEIQQQQVESLIEDLREAKQFEHECKTLKILNNSL